MAPENSIAPDYIPESRILSIGPCSPRSATSGFTRTANPSRHQERFPRRAGARRYRELHLARPAAHLRILAVDARRVAAFSRRVPRSCLDEDDDALCAPFAGVSFRGSEPARPT